MKFTSVYSAVLVVGICCFLFPGCDNSGKDKPDFDRKSMLQHYADNLVRPAYAELYQQVLVLKNAWSGFQSELDTAGLTDLQVKWKSAYAAWQNANAYNFGPAGEEGLRKGLVEEIGTFPANADKIETFILANDVSLNNFNRDTRGFLAIEYLLFKNPPLLLADAGRRNYLNAVILHLENQVKEVHTNWSTFTEEFINQNGTDVGSSTSLLYNEFVRSFENIKNFKVGLPAGKRPGQTSAAPELVEAYYSGLSLEYLKLHIAAIESIYYGRSTTAGDGPGFKEYLDFVVGGPELVVATEMQWLKVKAALTDVPTDKPLAQLITEGHPSVDVLHTELQKHTRFFKSDMSSLLGIAITYSSGDGD